MLLNPIYQGILLSQLLPQKTDQQEPNNEEFDCCGDHTSSDSSNDSESAVEENIIVEGEDDDPLEEESNQSINSAHGADQLSIQCNNVLQPPDPIWLQKLNYWMVGCNRFQNNVKKLVLEKPKTTQTNGLERDVTNHR